MNSMHVRVSPRIVAVAAALLCLIVSWHSPPNVRAQTEKRWTTTGFEQFAKGELDSSGANLYISRKGTLQTINLFDLNHDGYLDLLFNQTHDYNSRVNSVLYLNGTNGFLPDRRRVVLADGGYKALAQDLNGDGRTDLVLVNRFNGTTHR